MIDARVVAKATPDGYTLGAGTISNLSAHPRPFDRPLFDVERDLAPLSLSIKHPWLLYVHASVPAQTFQQFVALAKAKPAGLTHIEAAYRGPKLGRCGESALTWEDDE